MSGVHDHMISDTNPWDDDYRQRGRLWGGSTPGFTDLPEFGRILELGCGNGKTVSGLCQNKSEIIAIDVSCHATLLCKRAGPDPDRLHVFVADARQLPFRDGTFSAVIAAHIAGHLSAGGRPRLAREAFRLLAPGGMVFFSDFSCRDFRYGKGVVTEPGTFLRKNGISTHYFSMQEVRDLFSAFDLISLEDRTWEMRVRGRSLTRQELVARFTKKT